MTKLLAAVSRDTQRLRPVTELDEAKRIIDVILGVDSVVTAAPEHAPDDFWVTVPLAALSAREEFATYGVVDATINGVGRMTARVEEE